MAIMYVSPMAGQWLVLLTHLTSLPSVPDNRTYFRASLVNILSFRDDQAESAWWLVI